MASEVSITAFQTWTTVISGACIKPYFINNYGRMFRSTLLRSML